MLLIFGLFCVNFTNYNFPFIFVTKKAVSLAPNSIVLHEHLCFSRHKVCLLIVIGLSQGFSIPLRLLEALFHPPPLHNL